MHEATNLISAYITRVRIVHSREHGDQLTTHYTRNMISLRQIMCACIYLYHHPFQDLQVC